MSRMLTIKLPLPWFKRATLQFAHWPIPVLTYPVWTLTLHWYGRFGFFTGRYEQCWCPGLGAYSWLHRAWVLRRMR